MTNSATRNLKFGRRTPTNKPKLLFSEIWRGIVPNHPQSVDYLAALKNWAMLGNDDFGDCVAVTAANLRRLATATLATEYYPTLAEVYALYRTQNPDFVPDPNNPVEDNGMDIQTCLGYWNKNQWGGTKLVAFAAVDYTDLEQLKAAIAIFGGVWLGINVEAVNMTQFDAGKPWDYSSRSAIEGGHSILAGGYLGQAKADVAFVTWARECAFTDNFAKHLFEEAWVVIQPENLGTKQFQQGIDLTALTNAYQALTGRPLPIPAPTPVPPTPPAKKQWVIASQSEGVIILNQL